MIRNLLFTLILFICFSCGTDQAQDATKSTPPAQLTALEKQTAPQREETATSSTEHTETSSEKTAKVVTEKNKVAEAIAKTRELKADKKTTAKANNNSVKTTAPPANTTKPAKRPVNKPEAPSHQTWGELLQQYVSSTGTVNYQGLQKDQAKLQGYLEELAANPVQNHWPRNEKLAYWINAYNAFTVKLILDNYPVSSITKIHGGQPWDVKWIKLGDKTYSLNNIENDIIRPQFQEPRIHFAVNCAARSCPPLLNKAWTASNLNRYLEQQARSFINNSRYNEIGPEAVVISKIFEWYSEDFGNIINYLNNFSETSIQGDAKVSYKEYDWGLNE